MDSLFPVGISEKEFVADLEKAKIIVDNGIKDYFILLNATSFKNVNGIGNTTLKDCLDIFGLGYVVFFRFAGFFDGGCNGAVKDEYQTFSIRPITNNDKAKLRHAIKYFPKDTWICDWRDGTGAGMLIPFIQDQTSAEITWLWKKASYNRLYDASKDDGRLTAPEYHLKSCIEKLPDYFDCQLAIYNYKNVDIAIPIAAGTAKTTFKNREKDEFGVKRHIVHNVKAHQRINSQNGVERHLRGSSDIVLNGEKITISSPLEWSTERNLKKALEKELNKSGHKNKRKSNGKK